MNTKQTTALTGSCLCGNIRYQTSALPFDGDYCHCRQCQQSIGAPVGCWIDFKTSEITWLKAAPKEYASSARVRRGFCPECGCSISYRHLDHPNYLTLTIASLDEPNRIEPNYHIHTESQLDWFGIDDDKPHHHRQRRHN